MRARLNAAVGGYPGRPPSTALVRGLGPVVVPDLVAQDRQLGQHDRRAGQLTRTGRILVHRPGAGQVTGLDQHSGQVQHPDESRLAVTGLDRPLVGGAGTVLIAGLAQQVAQAVGGGRGVVRVPGRDGLLERGPGLLRLPVAGQELPQLQRG
jgi:hypothetical protein